MPLITASVFPSIKEAYLCFVIVSRQFKITFMGNDREFFFKAKNEPEALSWMSAIHAHIQKSKGFLA